ncbi:MAG: DUF2628 domain-containing protein [Alphaproteobacteria bacterium]|nr:DUF2628 domain-containing protein [Alphaproteobacteria bacterium]
MRIYTVHLRGEREGGGAAETVVVREGFSWAAFLVPPLWALYHRLWLTAVLMGVIGGAVAYGLLLRAGDPATGAVMVVIVLAGFGAIANDLRRWFLARSGFRLAGVVAGEDLAGAEHRWFAAAPRAASPPARSLPHIAPYAFDPTYRP